MNRNDLVEAIAKAANMKKMEAEKALQGLIETMSKGLAAGEAIALTGFGSFSIASRPARTGRNPQTGKKIEIPARKVVKFRPGKNLSMDIE
jgi:DNA-binding protein HU-beta